MSHARLTAMAAAVLLFCTLAVAPAFAQAALPYKAYGISLKPGQVVEVFNGAVSVGKATVDADGNWVIDIQPGVAAANDVISFTLDGKPTSTTVVFASGQFTPPPGLTLVAGAASSSTATPFSPAGATGCTPSRRATPCTPSASRVVRHRTRSPARTTSPTRPGADRAGAEDAGFGLRWGRGILDALLDGGFERWQPHGAGGRHPVRSRHRVGYDVGRDRQCEQDHGPHAAPDRADPEAPVARLESSAKPPPRYLGGGFVVLRGFGEEDGDQPLGPRLVLGVGREGGDDQCPEVRPLRFSLDLAYLHRGDFGRALVDAPLPDGAHRPGLEAQRGHLDLLDPDGHPRHHKVLGGLPAILGLRRGFAASGAWILRAKY